MILLDKTRKTDMLTKCQKIDFDQDSYHLKYNSLIHTIKL